MPISVARATYFSRRVVNSRKREAFSSESGLAGDLASLLNTAPGVELDVETLFLIGVSVLFLLGDRAACFLKDAMISMPFVAVAALLLGDWLEDDDAAGVFLVFVRDLGVGLVLFFLDLVAFSVLSFEVVWT